LTLEATVNQIIPIIKQIPVTFWPFQLSSVYIGDRVLCVALTGHQDGQ